MTGGYIFALSFGSFLCSKEYIIFEHEMHVGMVFAIAIVGVANVVSTPSFTDLFQHFKKFLMTPVV